MKIGPRETLLIVLLIAVPLSAWWFVFEPNDQRNQQMIKQIESRRAKLNELNRITGTIGDLRREITSLQEAITVLHSKLPSEKEMDKVIQEIWNLARNNNLTPLSVKTLNKTSDKIFTGSSSPHAEQPVRIVVDGDFIGFYAFLQELESRPRIMRIHKIKLEKSDNAADGHVKADFAMSIFFEQGNKAEI